MIEIYHNCKIKIADYSEYDAKFTFAYGGEFTAICKLAHNAYALTGYMRDIVPVDITVENGSIIKVEPHEG